MLHVKGSLYIRVLAAVMLLLGVAATPAHAKKKNKKKAVTEQKAVKPTRTLPAETLARYRYFFQAAMGERMAGRDTTAMELLRHCATLDPQAAETYFYMADCYNEMGQDSLQIEMLRKAAALQPDNTTYKESLIPIFLHEGKLADAVVTIEDLLRLYPERTDMLNLLLQIYNYQSDNAMCLDVLGRLEIQNGPREETTMAKVQILTRLKRIEEAHQVLKQWCDSHPLDLHYRVMFGNWLMGQHNEKEAVAQYRIVLKEEPDNEQATLSLYDYYHSQGLNEQANEQRDKLLLNPSTSANNRNTMIKMWVRDAEAAGTDTLTMLQLFDRYIEAAVNREDLLLLKASYMEAKGMNADSILDVYKCIAEQYPENAEAHYHLIQSAWQGNDAETMTEYCRQAIAYCPEKWEFYYFLTIGLAIDKQYDELIKMVNQSRSVMTTDTDSSKKMASDMFMMLGDAYHYTDQMDKAIEAYDECLALNPDNIGCMNNYAYYLAQDGKDLEKAVEMSLRTVNDQPSNPTYLDTYAWVLYCLGRYEEAEIYIDLALQFMAEDEDDTVYREHAEAIKEKIQK